MIEIYNVNDHLKSLLLLPDYDLQQQSIKYKLRKMSNFKIKIGDRVVTKAPLCDDDIPEGLAGTVLNDRYCFCVKLDDDKYNLYDAYPDINGKIIKESCMNFSCEEELELINTIL